MALPVSSPASELIVHKRLHLPLKTHAILASAHSLCLDICCRGISPLSSKNQSSKSKYICLLVSHQWKKEEIPWSTLFFQRASTSSFPSTSGLTEWVSECVCFGVCVCTHVYVFVQGPIKQLMLAVFSHCEMGGWLSVSPLALTYE